MPKTDGLISLPMYAKYSRLRLDQIPMTRLLLDMHEPYNREHIKFLKDSVQTILESEGLKDQYTIFAFNDILDNSVKVSCQTILMQIDFSDEFYFLISLITNLFFTFIG